MTRRARLALWLWLGWAVVSWNVAFAAQTRLVAIQFAHSQLENWQRGQRVISIEEGFRPQVRAAAIWASALAAAIAVTGIGAVTWASRPSRGR